MDRSVSTESVAPGSGASNPAAVLFMNFNIGRPDR
jgi:hypothetical protein